MLLTILVAVAAAAVAITVHRRTNWLGFLSRKFKPVAPGAYILITGCDTGFGRLSTERLSAVGFHVLAGCLQDASVAELNKLPNVTAFKLDVTSETDRRRCVDLIEKQCPNKLGALINNAGISDGFIAEWTDVATYRRVMDINFFAAVALTNACLPYLRRSGGRILNVSSAAGYSAVYAMAAYTASKHAMAAYSEVLRQETADSGVSVSTIMPGFARTNILVAGGENVQRCAQNVPIELTQPYPKYVTAGTLKQLQTLQRHGTDPKYTIDAMEHAITSPFPKARYVIGLDANVLRLLNLLPSALLDRLFLGLIKSNISQVTQ